MAATQKDVSLDQEVAEFSTGDAVALGDLQIRKNFARNVMILFAVSNVFVLFGLGIVFGLDCVQLQAKLIAPTQRIITGPVVMSLLGATTVQLGTVIFTIARAIFPIPPNASAGRLKGTSP